ncbi:unnamed protein product [Mytilus coruscus]|uniref:Uncharacterized protein n=1 Tax=Mytilus coruscus TaxID=42192 RepID=A0A6J8E5N8_MYTCO|nr:unnamed protein product [Mytilus coruscus]
MCIYFQIITKYAKSFDFKCPVHAHWKNWANEKCNSTLKYFCLHNDVERKYVEGCTGPDWDRSGSKRVYAGDFTRGDCIQERFQPFEFQTNASMSDCIYAKSHCNEEGHIKNNDGTSKYDRTCRCDHKQNYAFIKIPRNPFFCKPAEEDCSCYIKSCPENYTLSKGKFL